MAVSSLQFRFPKPIATVVRRFRKHLPPLNFITLHYLYFFGVCLLASVIFWGSSTPPRQFAYIDCLFLAVSAMTLAGLNTVNLSELNTWQQIILFLLTLLGSAILVSSVVVHVRLRAFERRFKSIVESERQKKIANKAKRTKTFPLSVSFGKTPSRNVARPVNGIKPEVDGVVVRGSVIRPSSPIEVPKDEDSKDERLDSRTSLPLENADRITESPLAEEPTESDDPALRKDPNDADISSPTESEPPTMNHIKFSMDAQRSIVGTEFPRRTRRHSKAFSLSGVGARQNLLNDPQAASGPYTQAVSFEKSDQEREQVQKYVPSSSGWIARNSQFHGLSLAEREKLGGVEYRAILILSYVVPFYFVSCQLFGAIAVGAWTAVNAPELTRANGLNPWWVGVFNAISAFNNNGMSLLDANMVAFQTSIFPLIVMGWLILAGNTAYPVFLRAILWGMKLMLPKGPAYRDERVAMKFLLDHPRRCYTNLFPKAQTYWLAASLVILNGTDWIMFEILNIGNQVVESLPPGSRWLDGLFQAIAVRSGGFYVVSIASLRSGLLVLYVLMMYISVYPITITMRSSNTYEERSLGVYADDSPVELDEAATNIFQALKRRVTARSGKEESKGYFIRQQLRGQLAHDLWWLAIALFLITIIETGQFERNPVVFSTFNIIFEIISAYACVGISTGVPWDAYSFCGAWHTLSKLILCAVMLRGRHRGLPVAIDRAVLLPGEDLSRAEEEDGTIRMERMMSQMKNNTAVV